MSENAPRQIVLDTETTGIGPEQGHRIIEVGCLELVGRRRTGRTFHKYLNPERAVDQGAVEVHGLDSDFLADKPLFADIAAEFIEFVRGAELIIHNAPFDVGFIDAELSRLGSEWGRLADHCAVHDTLAQARLLHPGQRNSLDALCGRYGVDNSNRELHGALLDSDILAEVYLAMTGGQKALGLGDDGEDGRAVAGNDIRRLAADRGSLPLVEPTAEEEAAHQHRLAALDDASGGQRPPWPD
ncbi:MAG: DNA polymerase III subunit epsilon [Pseudomonadota bacterium]